LTRNDIVETVEPYSEEEGLFEHYKIVCDPGQKPMRIDQFLTSWLRNASRTKIKTAALANCIRVNHQVVKASYKVKPGDEISYLMPYPPAPKLEAQYVPLNFVFEDDEVIVINKQAGLVVHPGVGNWHGTMVHGLLWHFAKADKKIARVTGKKKTDDELTNPLLVHRIDKDTSGLVVVAKTEFAHAYLSQQFYDRTTDRLYNALVWGDVKEDAGTIIGHVGRSQVDRKKFRVYLDGNYGKYAVTHYKVLERFGFCTLVECKLETGRTHQIRVHMKHLGHTLFSDTFYGGDQVLAGKPSQKYLQFIRNCQEILPTQALHAKTLGFSHPTSGERLFFDQPLPPNFEEVLQRMRTYAKDQDMKNHVSRPVIVNWDDEEE
jgi:23S rRNA pseudouridine1911/1915/1917 synthase